MDLTSDIKEEQTVSVHRATLLSGILSTVPREIMHANKKITRIDDVVGEDGVILHFQDGTEEHADAVIGADGIHGYMRKYILGDDPSVNASFAGYWDCPLFGSNSEGQRSIGRGALHGDKTIWMVRRRWFLSA